MWSVTDSMYIHIYHLLVVQGAHEIYKLELISIVMHDSAV